MEIRVNDYIRTDKGTIDKCVDSQKLMMYKMSLMFEGEKPIKSSSNIIDLIECGDFCKIEFYSPRYGERVTRIFEVEFRNKNYVSFKNSHCDLLIIDGNWSNGDKELNPIIKSIVTKQMMESISYTVQQ